MNKEETEKRTQNQNPNSNTNPNNQNQNQSQGSKGKSCKGCLYYSSALKSNSRNPTCVGIPRTLPQGLFFNLTFYTSFILMINRVSYVLLIQLDYFVKTRKKDMYWMKFLIVPSYIIGESEMEASKEGRTLTDFKYACVGYSVYLDNNDSSTHRSDKHTELPFCVGLEVFPFCILGIFGDCGFCNKLVV